jgi:putative salt-induced outer membrane protein YdiY
MLYSPVKVSVFILLLAITMQGMAQKTDKVVLKNGDMLTGEIKNLKFAKLNFDITGPGTISIKWEEIVKVISNKSLQLTLRSGEVLVTNLDSLFFNRPYIQLDDIVEIVQIKDNFLQRLDGDINLGFSYTKSSDIVQFNFNSTTTYRKPKIETNFKVNSTISDKSTDSIVSKKQDATINHFRKLNNKFYVTGDLGWQQNTQLGLANRFLLGVGTGKILINDNQHRLLTGTGLSFNLEQSNQNVESGFKKNLEALALIQFKKFRYSSPKISLDAQYTIYPSLTEWGRVRMDFQLNTKVELVKDFFAGISMYDLFDNRPPSGAASKNDFGINFTIGYEFGK